MTTDLHDAEARLRAALASRADDVEPREVDVTELERRAAAARHALARRRTILLASAAVLVVVAAIAGVALLRDDPEEPREPVVAGPPPDDTVVETTATSATAATTATTVAPSTTTATTATTATTVPDDGVQGWPRTADPRVLGTAEEAALAFADDVFGFADATVTATEGAAGSVYVSLTPRPTAGATSTVRLHDTGARGWVVLQVLSDQGRIDSIGGGEDAVVVDGVATAFEGTVTARVLDQDGDVLGEATGQAGSNGEQGAYAITVPVTGEGVPWFVLVGEGDASGEGDLNWAAMSPIAG